MELTTVLATTFMTFTLLLVPFAAQAIRPDGENATAGPLDMVLITEYDVDAECAKLAKNRNAKLNNKMIFFPTFFTINILIARYK